VRTGPASVDWHGCPAGASDNRWYCFYDGQNFTGRRLQWNLPHCQYTDFDTWAFRAKTSSWVNTGRLTVWGMAFSRYSGVYAVWTEEPQVSYGMVRARQEGSPTQLLCGSVPGWWLPLCCRRGFWPRI